MRCKGDADTHIVKEALVFAYEGRSVTIVADDTDVLILLMYHWDPSMANIFMRSEPKKKSPLKIVNIEKNVSKVSSVITKNLLFIHAWGGCDTTSAISGYGKTKVLNLVKKELPEVSNICNIFNSDDATQQDIAKAGVDLFKILGIQ